jgi:hypothetical protein
MGDKPLRGQGRKTARDEIGDVAGRDVDAGVFVEGLRVRVGRGVDGPGLREAEVAGGTAGERVGREVEDILPLRVLADAGFAGRSVAAVGIAVDGVGIVGNRDAAGAVVGRAVIIARRVVGFVGEADEREVEMAVGVRAFLAEAVVLPNLRFPLFLVWFKEYEPQLHRAFHHYEYVGL